MPEVNPFEALNLLSRLFLSAVMLASGMGKWQDPVGTRQAMRDFGCPATWTGRVARALPAVELTLAGLLLFDTTSDRAALALAVLLSLFCAGMSRLLRQRKAPPCHCFGAFHSKPVTRSTLVRTLFLLGLSLMCREWPTYSLTSTWTQWGSTALGFALSAIALHRLAGAQASRQPTRRLRTGQRLPAIRTSQGTWLDDLLARDRPTILIFTSASCPPCQQMESDLSLWSEALRDRLHFVRISIDPESIDEQVALSDRDMTLLDVATPGALLVDAAGTLLAPAVSKRDLIEALVRTALHRA